MFNSLELAALYVGAISPMGGVMYRQHDCPVSCHYKYSIAMSCICSSYSFISQLPLIQLYVTCFHLLTQLFLFIIMYCIVSHLIRCIYYCVLTICKKTQMSLCSCSDRTAESARATFPSAHLILRCTFLNNKSV